MSSPAVMTGPTLLGKKNFRILYADDMRELRHLLELALGRDGHTIQTVADGRQAFDKINADPLAFDMVITDHHMPVMNGLELVGRLRLLPFPGKIVVFSSELSVEVSAAYRGLQVECILPKPIFPRTLRAVLAAL